MSQQGEAAEKRKNKSLAGKIMKWITIPIIFIFLASGILILKAVQTTVTDLSKTELNVTSQSASYQINEFFTMYSSRVTEASVNKLYEHILTDTTANERLQDSSYFESAISGLEKSAVTDDNILSCWLADFDASAVIMSDGFISEPGWDVTQRPWYKVNETKKTVITEPYEDANTGKQVVTIVAPVFDESGNIIGASGVDIATEKLAVIMKEYNMDESIQFMLSDDVGTIVYHPEETLIGKNVREIGMSDSMVNNILNNVRDFTRYTYNGEENCGCVGIVGETNWNITSMKSMKDFNSIFYGMAVLLISIFLIGIVIIVLALLYVASTIVKPLKALTGAAKKIAEGNLDIDIAVESKDEIGVLSDAITATVSRLKEYIKYINEVGGVLDQIADGNLKFHLECEYVGEFERLKSGLLNIQKKLTETLAKINDAAAQVSEGAFQIAQTACTIAESSTEQSESVTKLSQSINEVAGLTQQNQENAEKANDSAKMASEYLDDGNRQISQLTETIKEINEVSKQINGIMETINDIAGQTNMLSLNASIEAARAGEAGKGFAVVASEIGNLAVQTTGSSTETGKLIHSILKSIEESSSMAQRTTGVMDNVLGSAVQAAGMISSISEAIVNEKEAIDVLLGEVNEIMAAVENNTAASEESVAASEELANQAEMLKELVEEFVI